MRGLLMRWSERFAAFGGAALLGAIAVTLVSVLGSALFGKPLLGDTEIVEILVGVAVACFMPYCQMRGANVIVDFFTARASARLRDALDAVAFAVFTVIVAVLTERMIEGAFTQYERERVSMFLRIPQWWGYAAASVAGVLWVAVCAWTAWERLAAFVSGRKAA